MLVRIAVESGLKASEPNLTRYDLFNADECFLTGTGAELVPVTTIDARRIGTGRTLARGSTDSFAWTAFRPARSLFR